MLPIDLTKIRSVKASGGCVEATCFPGTGSRTDCHRLKKSVYIYRVSLLRSTRKTQAKVTMEINNLRDHVVGGIKKRAMIPFISLKWTEGTKIGVDISILLHKYCHAGEVAFWHAITETN